MNTYIQQLFAVGNNHVQTKNRSYLTANFCSICRHFVFGCIPEISGGIPVFRQFSGGQCFTTCQRRVDFFHEAMSLTFVPFTFNTRVQGPWPHPDNSVM
jgi:hypothetical protein